MSVLILPPFEIPFITRHLVEQWIQITLSTVLLVKYKNAYLNWLFSSFHNFPYTCFNNIRSTTYSSLSINTETSIFHYRNLIFRLSFCSEYGVSWFRLMHQVTILYIFKRNAHGISRESLFSGFSIGCAKY